MRRAKLLNVIGGALDLEVPGVEDTMAASLLPCSDSGKLKRHNFSIEQCNHPAYGTYKALGLAGAPVHILRPIDRGDLFGQSFREYIGSRASFACDGCGEIFTFGCADFF